eukprot:TRINITY_DN28560_c0_g1_i3.p1 TRINITY_DN28560_c0_g1~~TRINITY_DN28560_c0_g1_i3.p1  ORF type:complete len:161 (-),score=26.86 TRINITY_DN28560_c0_g1_i3:455-937(-)
MYRRCHSAFSSRLQSAVFRRRRAVIECRRSLSTIAGLQQARQLLGVGVGATEAEVKQAFRVAAMQWHPDISTLPDAKERFQEAQSALEMLLASDPAAQSIGSASSGASSQTMGSKANAGWPSWYSWDLDEKFRRGWVPGQEPWAMEDADSLGITVISPSR